MNVKVYATSPIAPAIREALLAGGTQLTSVATFDERRAADTIHADNLDILVDIAAFGPYAKPGLLSCRPARVQITLPGLTHPAGIGELDYRLSDQVADLHVGPEPDSPAVVIVEGGVFPLLSAPQVPLQLTRLQLGIAESAPVFGVLATAARLSSRCLTTWKALIDRVPVAVFFVCPLEASDREPIRRLLLAAGVDASRIAMLPATYPRPRDLCLAGVVDVMLDTMPGSDYFSTRAAILDAIPLVTISGRMLEERVALSLLTGLGETSTVVASGGDYVELAAQLATDAIMRASLADHLRRLLQKSPIADMTRYVTRFEDALFRATAVSAASRGRTDLAS